MVNGMFPGPLIEANWGDYIEVNVHNDINGPEEPTTLHWHGLNMPGTPWFDGVPITSQCPITPGNNITYRFRADEYGTSWYHSHVSAQYTQGVVGPIVIHGPSEHVEYDDDLGPVLVSDWYHQYYTELVDIALRPAKDLNDLRPFADSNLLAGAGRYPCSNITDGTPCTEDVPYPRWSVEAGKTYRLRFVNTGSVSFFTITLDSHAFTVIAVDFVPVQPYETDRLILAVGQRMDVVITASADPAQSYWLRASNSPTCADTKAEFDAFGIISYPGASPGTEPPPADVPPVQNPLCDTGDIAQLQPVYPMAVEEPDLTLTLHLSTILLPTGQGTSLARFVINNETFDSTALYSNPLLPSVLQGVSSFPPDQNVYATGSARVVRIILISEFLPGHPMHLHGHDFQVLAQGVGEWDGTITNPGNPARRDVQMMYFGANASDPTVGPNYMVIQYEADNPGVWPLHCHLAWHLAAGMMSVIVERQDDLQATANELPQEIARTCALYKEWASTQQGMWGEEGPDTKAGSSSNSTKRAV